MSIFFIHLRCWLQKFDSKKKKIMKIIIIIKFDIVSSSRYLLHRCFDLYQRDLYISLSCWMYLEDNRLRLQGLICWKFSLEIYCSTIRTKNLKKKKQKTKQRKGFSLEFCLRKKNTLATKIGYRTLIKWTYKIE